MYTTRDQYAVRFRALCRLTDVDLYIASSLLHVTVSSNEVLDNDEDF